MCAGNSVHSSPVDPGKRYFSLSELNKLVGQVNSCISVVTSKRCITLMPHHLKNLSASIKELLSAKVSKYDVQLEGVILAHKNIKLIANSFKLSDCYSFPLEFLADIYLFKPKVGSRLTGIVNKITNEYINILVHRTFNVTVYCTGRVWATQIGSQVEVEVTALDYTSQLPYIKASLIFPGYDEGDTTQVKTKKKKKKSKDYEGQTSLIGISQREEPLSLIGVSQRKELVSILKNSPLRMISQSSTEVEMESQEAESSSTESSKARTKETPAVQAVNEEGKAKKKKEKKKKSKSNDIEEGEKSSRKRKRDGETNDSASSSKKSKEDKREDAQTTPKSHSENTTQILPNDSIFEAASSTPVIAPSPKKKKRKLSERVEDPKQSELIESLLQLKMEEIMAPMDTSKTKAERSKIKVKPEADAGNHNDSSVVESESSNGRKRKKKKKKDHEDKTGTALSHALKSLKKEE